ncbi:MAG: S1C family serine protease [Acidobacteriota bacterium]
MSPRTLIAAVVAFAAGALLTIFAAQPFAPPIEQQEPAAQTPTPVALTSQRPLQQQIGRERRSVIVDAVQKVAPSVASVVVQGRRRVSPFGPSMFPFQEDFFDFFSPRFRPREESYTQQSGSAVIISASGEVLTNDHVIDGADAIFLLLPDGRSVTADIIGRSSSLDLALLRTDPTGLQPAPLGRSKDLVVGEWLVAVGYPVGQAGVTSASRFQPTVTVGVVSATERSFTPRRAGGSQIHYYADMIQTDAAINPGNSGGPLANAAGEVIGINTVIITESGGSQGLGFAIPVERALRAAKEFREYGKVRQADPGTLQVQTVTAELAEYYGLEGAKGMLIAAAGGEAARAGLREEDVLLDVDGKVVNSLEELRLALLPRFVGDTVILGVWRGGRHLELPLTLQEAHR